MTPYQLDHLSRIKTHLETLLANAEKRTPGEWKISESVINQIYTNKKGSNAYIADIIGVDWGGVSPYEGKSNAAFIASCAGNAEAGWRSTLAAIELIEDRFNSLAIQSLSTYTCLSAILTAWPLESLK